MYVNEWGEMVALPNATVWEDTRTTRVTYPGDNDTKFRVLVRQKPNPIGFHASLPGDKRQK